MPVFVSRYRDVSRYRSQALKLCCPYRTTWRLYRAPRRDFDTRLESRNRRETSSRRFQTPPFEIENSYQPALLAFRSLRVIETKDSSVEILSLVNKKYLHRREFPAYTGERTTIILSVVATTLASSVVANAYVFLSPTLTHPNVFPRAKVITVSRNPGHSGRATVKSIR